VVRFFEATSKSELTFVPLKNESFCHMSMPQLKITYKMAIILATMSFGPMLAGGITGMIPFENNQVLRERQNISRQLATSCSTYLSQKDTSGLQKACRAALMESPDLKSMQIIRYDGLVLFTSPDHHRHWNLPVESPSTMNQIRIPLNRGEKIYAELEIAFEPVSQLFSASTVKWLLMLLIGFGLNFGSFSFFLTRALSSLDPKSAVPKRVRNTLDTIVGGVVILDSGGKILLVNESFSKCVGRETEELLGQSLSSLPWRHDSDEEWPWDYVLREHTQKTAIKVHLTVGDRSELSFVVNATPVLDGGERVSGALISFEDITVMEDQRKQLLQTMSDLETSTEQIRRQNEVLQELASRDGLTGAFNRRALYEKIDAIWPTRNCDDRGLITIMMDVDHFKKLNDQHGHAAGDSVLKGLVKTVQGLIGNQATLARYGGEEFCVMMESATVEQGVAMAEHIRAGIQEQLAEPYRVTASIGVSSSLFGAPNISMQIEQADQALYAAKHGGRNAVRCWSLQLEQEALEAERKKAAKLSAMEIEDHPISYHAVVTLNSALAHRLPKIAAHSHRVAEMSVTLARGLLPVSQLYTLEIAAMLHDVGFVGMPDHACNDDLHSPDTSNKDARDCHVQVGLEVCGAAFNSPELLDILRYQHQPYSGPGKLVGEAIPIGARIVAIANAYDAMTSELNETPWSHEQAIAKLKELAGTLFDPVLVKKFEDSPLGWRPTGLFDSGMTDQQAIMIGYQLERVIHSFDTRNSVVLKTRLQTLQEIAKSIDMPMIAALIQELASEADRKAASDWDSLLPMLQDLVELCLTIQRAYLRTVKQTSKVER
jgi:diguanylate cyclase (GGDEF)-like protein/PAS domain S-box-containing protein